MIAQGNALGLRREHPHVSSPAGAKSRDLGFHGYPALSGLNTFDPGPMEPRALPWAITERPFGAQYKPRALPWAIIERPFGAPNDFNRPCCPAKASVRSG